MAEGVIFDIKEFAVHDGPGIRITVFFKGCHMRCLWCHNPEGLSFESELMIVKSSCKNCGKCKRGCTHEECRPFCLCTRICPDGLIKVSGEKVDSLRLAEQLKRHMDFLLKNHGGITLSGGEPLAQPEFLIDLLNQLKPLHTAVETSGYGSRETFREVIRLADLILFDIKHMNPIEHKRVTGVDNIRIHENLRQLIDSNRKFIARIPLIPGINDSIENMEKTAKLLRDASSLERVEFLPYNPFAGAKYPMLGRQYKPPFDEKRQVQILSDIFKTYGIRIMTWGK